MFNRMKNRNRMITPGGNIPIIYRDMAKQSHLLIAGKTGSGKSVVINGILYSLLADSFPWETQLVLIDPKRVELAMWKSCPHCICYASEPGQPARALEYALRITESRFQSMQKDGLKKYPGGHVYVVIDELADLMTTDRKNVVPLIQRLAQIGRAANVHLICATQCPLSKIIPTEIKVNFDSIVALKTATKQHSRNIIELPGCETLPPYGYCYYRNPTGITLEKLPMVHETELDRVARSWAM